MNRVFVYAHYDSADCVRDYVKFFLDAAARMGSVFFVSNSALSSEEQKTLRSLGYQVRVRQNVGYDFAMWADAIRQMDLSDIDELVLCNSSFVGPVRSLEGVFAAMDQVPCEFWGLSESHEHAWHLQSYFLVFRPAVLRSSQFAQFWNSVLPFRSKAQVIRSYELGLSQYFSDEGFVGKALVGREKLGSVPLWRRPFVSSRNPTSVFPIKLIKRGFPFIKIEAITHNPGKVWRPALYAECTRQGFDRALLHNLLNGIV